jgi:hypothetical protein
MGHLERGEKNVSFHTRVRLADALGITISELVANEGTSKRPATRRNPERKPVSATRSDDLDGMVWELNHRRLALEQTAHFLKDVVEALRKRKP